jgi:uncharacterized protein (TIGR00251 family)
MGWLTRGAAGARAALKVIPRASASGVRGVEIDGSGAPHLVVRVSAPAAAGKANAALIELLARRWRVARSDLEVVSGARARRKILQIRGASEALIARLEALEAAEADRP